jgi:glycosyltransferase involved in cell wall biosynthesis
VLSSRLEGGANVIGESIVLGAPILASRIPGSIGILGADYPGLFETGNTRELAELMSRAETDEEFYRRLGSCCEKLRPLFDPRREERAWKALLDEVKR